MINILLPLSLAASAFAVKTGVAAPTVSGIISVVYPGTPAPPFFISAYEDSGTVLLTNVIASALRVTIPAIKCSTPVTPMLFRLSTNTAFIRPYFGACLASGSADLSLADPTYVTGTPVDSTGAADITGCSGQSQLWSRICATNVLSLNWLTAGGVSVPTQALIRTIIDSSSGKGQVAALNTVPDGGVLFTGNYTAYLSKNPPQSPLGDEINAQTFAVNAVTLVFVPDPN